jgi:hypothetical protein
MLVLLFTAALVGFAKPPLAVRKGWRRTGVRVVMGVTHAAAQLLTVTAVALVALSVGDAILDQPWFAVGATMIAGVLGGVASGVVLGAYLGLWDLPRRGTHGNEAFSAMRLTRHKNFLRIHIDSEGALTIWVVGVRRVGKKWEFLHEVEPGAEDASWLQPEPERPLQPHLVERIDIP